MYKWGSRCGHTPQILGAYHPQNAVNLKTTMLIDLQHCDSICSRRIYLRENPKYPITLSGCEACFPKTRTERQKVMLVLLQSDSSFPSMWTPSKSFQYWLMQTLFLMNDSTASRRSHKSASPSSLRVVYKSFLGTKFKRTALLVAAMKAKSICLVKSPLH